MTIVFIKKPTTQNNAKITVNMHHATFIGDVMESNKRRIYVAIK